MNCPYCNNEMKLGHIDQTDFRFPLEWYPANKEVGLFKANKGNIRLTYAGSVKACRCENYKKIIIDEGTLNA